MCVDTVAPYTCDFDSTSVADGLRDIRAVALDAAGYSRTSTVTGRRIDNTAPATALTDPGSPLHRHQDADRDRVRRRLRRRVRRAPVPARRGRLDHDLRVGRRAASPPRRSPTGCTTCARSPPTPPATPAPRSCPTAASTTRLRPSSVTAARRRRPRDGHPGGHARRRQRRRRVTSVRYQVRPAATGVWVDACTATSAPFTCSVEHRRGAGRHRRRARDRDRRRRPGDHVRDRQQPDRQHRAVVGCR